MSKHFTLENGMKVLLVESHKSPVVSVQMWVKTGSADEKPGEEGLSHFIEHLVFKGTNKFGVGEIASKVEGAGGVLNAYTSFDETVFYVTISSSYQNVALEVISEMMGFPTFDPDEVDKEREVVLEEIKRSLDNPHRVASRNLFNTLYTEHPYGRPVIGYEKVVKEVSDETIRDYFSRRYVPENMTLVIVGDFNEEQIKKSVDEYFASFKKLPLEHIERKQEPAKLEPKIKCIDSNFKENILHMAWPIPTVKHEDIPALEMFSMIFGQGEGSRLMKALRIDKNIAKYGVTGLFTSLDQGFLSVSSAFEQDKMAEVLAVINEQAQKILSEPPTQEELDKVKVNYQSEEFYSLETVDGLSRKIGSYQMLFDDHNYYEKFMEQINKVTVADVVKVARKYMNPSTCHMIYMSDEDKEQSDKNLKHFVQEFKNDYGETISKPVAEVTHSNSKKISYQPNFGQKEMSHHKLDSGSRVMFQKSHETPVVSLKLALRGGLRTEKKRGLVELFTRVWGTQTESRSEAEIVNIIEKNASSIYPFGGRNTVGLNFTTLSPFYNDLTNLFDEIFEQPVFSEEVMKREKDLMINHLKNRPDRPSEIAVLGMMQNLFGQHPYAKDFYGSEEAINSLTAEDLKTYLDEAKVAEQFAVAVSGDIKDEQAIIDKFTQSSSQMKSTQMAKTIESDYPSEDRSFYAHSEKEQSHLILAYPGITFGDENKYALDVLQDILSGQGGRLFMELRDKASLAYTVSPIRLDGIDAGYFGGYIGCSPDKVPTAKKMMLEEFDKLVNHKISEEELKSAKSSLIGGHDIALQKNTSVASSMLFNDIYDAPYDEGFKYASNVNKVSAEQVQSLAQKLFSQNIVVSLVGPKDLLK